ncbi:MAG: SpoIIE family protein phosphatase [Gemmatimonadota bacterium]|nr:SpoIIE family protein phosphatase [Gemmatimonadota bacterium]
MLNLAVGDTISRYELLEKIGQGGMGVVYRALDTRLDREVALKFVMSSMAEGEDARERFLREARAAAALDHPNVGAVYEIDEADSFMFIAMAFIEGESLDHIIKTRSLDVLEAVDLAIQIGEGLAAAHEQGIIHRDVKTANVIVKPKGRAVVLDFGVARTTDYTPMTATGGVIGTTAYMCPEQFTGAEYDHRCDIWGLGVVLYEMLTGALPFEGRTHLAVMQAILNTAPHPVGALRAIEDMGVEHILNRALAKQPKRRYQTMSAFVADLRSVEEAARALEVAEESTDPLRRHSPRVVVPPPVEVLDRPIRILVVDDEPDLELLVRQHFRKQTRAGDLAFSFAGGGTQALETLEAEPHIGIVLTDIRMPGMDGLTLLGKMSELDRALKAVVVSAYGDLGNIRTAMNRGAFDFVTKPIDFSDLETTIAKAWSELILLREGREAQRRLSAVQQELDVARRIQDAMLPKSLPDRSDLDVYAFKVPAADVGGDFHDLFVLPDGRVALLVGEVVGTGVAATMLAVMARTLIKAIAPRSDSPVECLAEVGRLLEAERLNALSVTAVLAYVDGETGAVELANAGHVAPYLLSADEAPEPLGKSMSAALGQAGGDFFAGTATLEPGGGLFLYTDGVADTVDSYHSVFSRERLEAVLAECRGESAPELVRSVIRELDEFADGAPQHADVSVVALSYKGA